jgi:hypothetical protein
MLLQQKRLHKLSAGILRQAGDDFGGTANVLEVRTEVTVKEG